MKSQGYELQGGSICVYPYSDEVLPLLRHGILLAPEWKITSLVSLRSWGFVGQKIQGRDDTLTVTKSFEDLPEDTDYILIPEFFGNLNKPSVIRQILSRIIPFLGKIRGILLSTTLDEENYKMLKTACENVCEFIDLNLTLTVIDPIDQYERNKGLLEIDVPVVGIMGMWESTDKFEVSLALREKFIENGYQVSQIGSRNYCEMMGFHSFPRFMLDPSVGEAEKIFMLNRCLKQLADEETPDVIIVTVPGSTQQLNNKFPNGFGILPFLVSKAAFLDTLVLCTLYEPDAKALFEMISTSFKYKYGCEVDAFHMSNTMFDAASISEMDTMRLNHVSRNDVAKIVFNYADLSSPMVDVYDVGGSEKLYNIIVNKLTENVADTVL